MWLIIEVRGLTVGYLLSVARLKIIEILSGMKKENPVED